MRITSQKLWPAAGIILILALTLIWLTTTNNSAVWPIRNSLQYRVLTWRRGTLTQPVLGNPGTLQGTVRDMQDNPIKGAWVLVARRDGITYIARSDANGVYTIGNIPPGAYRPVAGAPGYDNVQIGGLFKQVRIKSETTAIVDITLPNKPSRTVKPGSDLWLTEPVTLTCTHPFESSAIRRQIHFKSGNRPNQPSFYYTPMTATTASQLPILLAIYPGPADTWECASLPLASAGYVVVAAGPTNYNFDLETEIDELERLLTFAQNGNFPSGDSGNIAILGGSYSSLHVQRLLQRRQDINAALLLGPSTDLFDMRRRLENEAYIPPFGLDRALIALGLPDREPLRYWLYSGAYHVRSDFPPLAILHSRSDKVVPYQQSELLAANLERADAIYELHFFDGASHYLLSETNDADTLKIYRTTLDFLDAHLR